MCPNLPTDAVRDNVDNEDSTALEESWAPIIATAVAAFWTGDVFDIIMKNFIIFSLRLITSSFSNGETQV